MSAVSRPYQDLWRGGLVRRGRRDCERRYGLVRDALAGLLGSGFTVADIGCYDAYFGTRLAEDLGAEVLNVDRKRRNVPGRFLRLAASADTVQQIGRHDAILAMSVLHHMADWREVYAGLRGMCRWLVVETPGPGEPFTGHKVPAAPLVAGPVHDQVSRDACQLIGHGDAQRGHRRPIFLVEGSG